MPSKVCDEITYPFPNFNSCTVEVLEWMSNFIPHFMMDTFTYPWWDQRKSMLAARALEQKRPSFCIRHFKMHSRESNVQYEIQYHQNITEYWPRCMTSYGVKSQWVDAQFDTTSSTYIIRCFYPNVVMIRGRHVVDATTVSVLPVW